MKKNANPQTSALVLGIISNVLNLIMTCVMFTADVVAVGGIFIVFPIYGFVNAFKALKQNGMNAIIIVSFILNAIGMLGALGFVVIYILARATMG